MSKHRTWSGLEWNPLSAIILLLLHCFKCTTSLGVKISHKQGLAALAKFCNTLIAITAKHAAEIGDREETNLSFHNSSYVQCTVCLQTTPWKGPGPSAIHDWLLKYFHCLLLTWSCHSPSTSQLNFCRNRNSSQVKVKYRQILIIRREETLEKERAALPNRSS